MASFNKTDKDELLSKAKKVTEMSQKTAESAAGRSMKIKPCFLVLAVIAIVFVVILSGGRSYNKTYDMYIKATMDGDAKAVVALLNDSYIELLIERGEIESKADLIQRVQNKLDWYSKCAEERGGDSYEFVAELRGVKDVELGEVNPYQVDMACGQNKKDLRNLKGAKTVNIYYNMYSDDNSLGFDRDTTIYTELIYFVKIGRMWYLGEISEYRQFGW